MDLLTVKNLSFQEHNHTVLEQVNFAQKAEQKLVIAGETGSGKSTLLQIIAGLVQPTSGEVFLKGKRVKGPQELLVPGEPGIAYLSQHFELPQFLRVEQVLQYANTLSLTEAENLQKICRIEHLVKRKTSELSGGERQRIALAKLLLGSPELLLLDEPFSNLDSGHKKILKTVLEDLTEKLEITTLLVSHDPSDTLSWADEILVLQAGKIVQRGTPEQIYRQPVNEYVAGLFGNYNLLPPKALDTFPAFPEATGPASKFMIRPEQIKLVKEGKNGRVGTVKSVCFFGNYYEVKVKVSSLVLKVNTALQNLKKGDQVYIEIAPEDVWVL